MPGQGRGLQAHHSHEASSEHQERSVPRNRDDAKNVVLQALTVTPQSCQSPEPAPPDL